MRKHLQDPNASTADVANVVQGAHYRVTVLDEGLVRLEYSESGEFEDRASQTVVDRAFPAVEFTRTESEHLLEIHTSRLHLIYDKEPFSTEGLSVQSTGGGTHYGRVWRYDLPTANLGGTARTLDEVDGACELEPGVLSRRGITVLDDSATVLLTDDGWVAPRRPGNCDIYVFAYGTDYLAAMRAFYTLTGPPPLLPRYALGNWWSRYHPYTQREYLELMDRFAAERIPMSVAVIDMDWHLTDIDPALGSGWTGYTWNPELFDDPQAFLTGLHERGLAISLNVHPADGIRAHEDSYPAMAARMGIDPASGQAVNFDPADRRFVAAYLEEVHHPLERQGVDFWWLDWQQGAVTKIPGLDPLWLLNHLHYLDSGRERREEGGRARRPLTFSRYAGPGSHRYPVGFSGDSVISWASLAFQPHFTATAANVGYGWWSHDIGGHYMGRKDDEMVVRWVQLGVYSPILRLHSSLSPFLTKEPWRWGEQARRLMSEQLRLRHRLVPYLYTMGRRAHVDGRSLVEPMYYAHPEVPAAYEVPTQFAFGDQLMVAAIAAPADRETLLGATTAWLPPGEWIDVSTGLTYRGDRELVLHRGLDSIPVLARSGAIVAMLTDDEVAFGTANPRTVELHLFAGADGEFTLAEDRDDEAWALTAVTYTAGSGQVRIAAITGEPAAIPDDRRYVLVLHGFERIDTVRTGGSELALSAGATRGSIRVELPAQGGEDLVVTLAGELSLRPNRDIPERVFTLLDDAQIDFRLKARLYGIIGDARDVVRIVAELGSQSLPPALFGALIELLTANPA